MRWWSCSTRFLISSVVLTPFQHGSSKKLSLVLAPFWCNSSIALFLCTLRRLSIFILQDCTGMSHTQESNPRPHQPSSCRPISNLSVISKLLEHLVLRQLVNYLDCNALLPATQSAYCWHHSTEMAVLKVVLDIRSAVDLGSVSLLLLDMSVAFDTVNNGILLNRLEKSFGVHQVALGWVRSCLTSRKQTILSTGGHERYWGHLNWHSTGLSPWANTLFSTCERYRATCQVTWPL